MAERAPQIPENLQQANPEKKGGNKPIPKDKEVDSIKQKPDLNPYDYDKEKLIDEKGGELTMSIEQKRSWVERGGKIVRNPKDNKRQLVKPKRKPKTEEGEKAEALLDAEQKKLREKKSGSPKPKKVVNDKLLPKKIPESPDVDPEVAAAIKSSESFDELYKVLNENKGLPGSQEFFPADSLKDLVRQYIEDGDEATITRSGGLRDKVIELKEKQTKKETKEAARQAAEIRQMQEESRKQRKGSPEKPGQKLAETPLGLRPGDSIVNKNEYAVTIKDVVKLAPDHPDYAKYGDGYFLMKFPLLDGSFGTEKVPFSKIKEKQANIKKVKRLEMMVDKDGKPDISTGKVAEIILAKDSKKNPTPSEIITEAEKYAKEKTAEYINKAKEFEKLIYTKKNDLNYKDIYLLLNDYLNLNKVLPNIIEHKLNGKTEAERDEKLAQEIVREIEEYRTKRKELYEKIKQAYQESSTAGNSPTQETGLENNKIEDFLKEKGFPGKADIGYTVRINLEQPTAEGKKTGKMKFETLGDLKNFVNENQESLANKESGQFPYDVVYGLEFQDWYNTLNEEEKVNLMKDVNRLFVEMLKNEKLLDDPIDKPEIKTENSEQDSDSNLSRFAKYKKFLGKLFTLRSKNPLP